MSIIIKCKGGHAKYKELEIALSLIGEVDGQILTTFPIKGLTRGQKGSKYYEMAELPQLRQAKKKLEE